jgi:CDGSH iron-sulfur domain-containing protein 3
MEKPVVASRRPYVLTLQPGKYFWCACGRSKGQPYCDGSHAGTGITPLEVTIDQPKQVAFCGCKATKAPPFCDGSHRNLPPA